ncbi:MAG: GMC family oxidoreductase [Deltaproteobacteria bacterium]|nr:GMC family oxidoreductase [Deltaproteobacteria bacterium]
MEELEADVCIIGGGLAGTIVAERALKRGRKVLLIDRGADYRTHDTDRSTWWWDHVVTTEAGIDGRFTRYKNDFPGAAARFDDLAEIESTADLWAFRYSMRYELGGSAARWYGLSFRLHPDDFKTKSLFGYGEDWPIGYDDLAPYYDQAEEILEVSGPSAPDAAVWPWHNKFVYPAFKQSYLDLRFEAASGGLVRLVPQPHAARNRPEWEGGCLGMKTCVQHCTAGAIFRPQNRILSSYLFNDRLHVLSLTAVTHLELSQDGAKIEAVHGVDSAGAPLTARARHFFLAANAVENVRILLASAEKTGEPVANRSGTVGRYFASNGEVTCTAVLDEPVFPNRGRPTTSSCLSWLSRDERAGRNAVVLEVWNGDVTRGGDSPWAQLAATWERQGLWGEELALSLADYEHRFSIVFSYETEMTAASTLSLGRARDRFGLPLARAAITPTARDLSTRAFIAAKAGALRGQKAMRSLAVARDGLSGCQPRGGTRMSASAETGVVGDRCRSHDHENLYVLGSGPFCSTGSFGPSLTIAALALYAADDPALGWS